MGINYTTKINGSEIDTAVKNKTSKLKGKKIKTAGELVWQTALDEIYSDFDSTLADATQQYMKTAKVIFPGVPVPVIVSLNAAKAEFSLNSLKKESGTIINDNIKKLTDKIKGDKIKDVGKIIWKEFCRQIGIDLLNKIPRAISKTCDNAVSQVGIGYTALPMTGSLAPAPPIYSGLISSKLEGTMNSWFSDGIISIGVDIDKEIKKETKKLEGDKIKDAGEKIWQASIDILFPEIKSNLTNAIKLFLLDSGSAWKTTPASGNPLVSGVPTVGTTPAEAHITII